MSGKLIILTILLLLFGVQPVLANDPPILQSPSNASTTTSPKLEWQVPSYQLYPTNPYRIQVDDDSSFAIPKKDYYTSNTNYTPSLDPGTWYWKVKAKDSTGAPSEWSSVWSFTLTPSSTPVQTNTPTPTASDATPQPSPSFTISNIPSQINSDQSFTVSVNISTTGNFYCKGAFKKSDSSNYFGLTKVSGNWIKNNSNFANQSQCSSNFNLEIKPDVDDSGYTGSGDYIFKVAKYDTDGGNLTWSSDVTIKINNKETSTPAGNPTPKPSSKPSPSSIPSSVKPQSSTPKPTPSINSQYQIASVEGIETSATPEAKVEVKNQKQTTPLIWIGLILIFAGSGSIGYIYLRRKTHMSS